MQAYCLIVFFFILYFFVQLLLKVTIAFIFLSSFCTEVIPWVSATWTATKFSSIAKSKGALLNLLSSFFVRNRSPCTKECFTSFQSFFSCFIVSFFPICWMHLISNGKNKKPHFDLKWGCCFAIFDLAYIGPTSKCQ